MQLKLLVHIVSGLTAILGVLLFIPGIYSLLCLEPDISCHGWIWFIKPGILALAAGLLARHFSKTKKREVHHKTAFAVVTFSWLAAAFIGAFPYFISDTLPSFTDSFFESISGFTGTGASVLPDIEGTDKALLLWRSMTQWLGGMGIVIFFLAILPLLGTGGVELFRAEATGPTMDKITPRVRETARNLWLLYFGFTALLTILLAFAGLSLYDAVNHAMTTLSTGGFSTKNAGVGAFQSSLVDYLITAFMLIGSINFSLHFKFLFKRTRTVFFDSEFKAYFWIVAMAVMIITLLNWGPQSPLSFEESFRSAFFTVAATASSTGFTNYDYISWPFLAQWLLLLLMLIGGMSGSTAGGMKCVRFLAAVKLIMRDIRHVLHPKAILGVKVNNQLIKNDVANAIWGFIFLYLLVLAYITILLTADGLDLMSAISATISALSNIGPALGQLGPFDNYAALPDLSKYALSAGMLMGRLEFFTVIVLLSPEYWKK